MMSKPDLGLVTKLTFKTEDYDFGLLRSFIGLFPESPLTQLLRSYFAYMSIPLTDAEEEEEEQQQGEDDENEEGERKKKRKS